MNDFTGQPLAVGDRVRKVHIDDGAPGWAETGTIVAVYETRIGVKWDGWLYEATAKLPAMQPHRPRPANVRKLQSQEAQR